MGKTTESSVYPDGLVTPLREDLDRILRDPSIPRTKKITLRTPSDVSDLGIFNNALIPESRIMAIVKNPALSWEPFPVVDPAVIHPETWVSERLTKSCLYGIPITTENTKKTAKIDAQKTALALSKKHGKHDLKKSEKFQKILWNRSADGSKNCEPFFMYSPTTSGIMQPDVMYCPDCGHVVRRRSHCDNPRCSQSQCGDHYARVKGDDFGARSDLIRKLASQCGIGTATYHIIVSMPADLSAQWIQNAEHYETMLRFNSEIMHGLGMSGWATVTHTHRGDKKHDRDLRDTIADLDLPIKSTSAVYDHADGGYYWRMGAHFHNVAIALNPLDMPYFKAFCKAFYSYTGILVKVIEHDNPAEAVRYIVTHMGIGTKINGDGEPAKRTMPAIRYYGTFSPRKSLKREDIGVVLAIPPCNCPECKGGPMSDIHGVPAIRPHKMTLYRPRPPRKYRDYIGEDLERILDQRPTVETFNNRGEPTIQKIITRDILKKLISSGDFYIPPTEIPRYIIDGYYYVPDYYPEDLAVPCMVSEQYNGPEEEITETPVPRQPSREGQIYDTLELLDMLGAEISRENIRNIGLSEGARS